MSFPITYQQFNSTATLTANLSGTGLAVKDSGRLDAAERSFIDQGGKRHDELFCHGYLVNSGNEAFTVGTLVNSNSAEFSTTVFPATTDAYKTVQPGGTSCYIQITLLLRQPALERATFSSR